MKNEISIFNYSKLSKSEIIELCQRTESDLGPYIDKIRPVVEAVKEQGDIAAIEYTRLFDGADLSVSGLKVTEEEFDTAIASLSDELIESIDYAIENIRKFHEAQMPQKMWLEEIRQGVFAGERYTPIDTVACYVPRGKASYPSSVMMVAVPAVVAKVPNTLILTPPGADGSVDSATLFIARRLGITNVFKLGGAQAVAAAAYGTESIPKCDKFLGPGSPWVMAAKRLVVDVLDPGISAGPSECIILADDTANGKIAALDLGIESEHGSDSSVFLVTPSQRVVDEVLASMESVWNQLGEQRQGYSRDVLCGKRGGIVLTNTMSEAIDFVNQYAPEHLEILAEEPFDYLGSIVNASEILLGENTPVSIGNFALGANAVLPTNAQAKTVSPLSVFDYLKRNSIGHITRKGYAEIAKHSLRIAQCEGFDGHGLAVSEFRDNWIKK